MLYILNVWICLGLKMAWSGLLPNSSFRAALWLSFTLARGHQVQPNMHHKLKTDFQQLTMEAAR